MIYFRYGDGPKNILFLHGLNGNSRFWRNLLLLLPKKFSCWAVSLPSYNRSNLDNDALLVKEFLWRHKIDRPYLVCFSFGGLVGLKLISLGLTFKRQIFISTPFLLGLPRTQKSLIELAWYLDTFKTTEPLVERAICKFMQRYPTPAVADSYFQFAKDMLDPRVMQMVRNVKICTPFVVVHARKDPILWLFNGKDPCKNLRPQKTVLFESTHFVPKQFPAKIAQIINTFFV